MPRLHFTLHSIRRNTCGVTGEARSRPLLGGIELATRNSEMIRYLRNSDNTRGLERRKLRLLELKVSFLRTFQVLLAKVELMSNGRRRKKNTCSSRHYFWSSRFSSTSLTKAKGALIPSPRSTVIDESKKPLRVILPTM